MPGRHDEMPVLPREATDLKVHVEQCALRYNALVRLHHNVLSRVRRMMWMNSGIFTMLVYIAWELLQKRL